MNSQNIRTSITKSNVYGESFAWPQHMPQYIICAVLGIMSGATSVALAIGLAITAQVMLPPTIILTPNAFLITVTAVMLGFGVAWFISRIAHRFFSNLPDQFTDHGIQVLLVFSVLTCLLQGFLFFHGM